MYLTEKDAVNQIIIIFFVSYFDHERFNLKFYLKRKRIPGRYFWGRAYKRQRQRSLHLASKSSRAIIPVWSLSDQPRLLLTQIKVFKLLPIV